jgi:hypothetical protein
MDRMTEELIRQQLNAPKYKKYSGIEANVALIGARSGPNFSGISFAIEALIASGVLAERAEYSEAWREFWVHRPDLLQGPANKGLLARELEKKNQDPTAGLLLALAVTMDKQLVRSPEGRAMNDAITERAALVSALTPRSANNLPPKNIQTRSGVHRTETPAETLARYVADLEQRPIEELRERVARKRLREQPVELTAKLAREESAEQQHRMMGDVFVDPQTKQNFPLMPSTWRNAAGVEVAITKRWFMRASREDAMALVRKFGAAQVNKRIQETNETNGQ